MDSLPLPPDSLPVIPETPPKPPAVMPTAPAPASAPANASLPGFFELVRRTFEIWKIQWWRIGVAGFLPGILGFTVSLFLVPFVAFFGMASLANPAFVAGVAVAILAGFLLMAWLGFRFAAMQMHLVLAAKEGIGLKEAWQRSKGLSLSLFWIGILTLFAVGGGMLALVVPGVIWAVSFGFAPWVRVDEGLRGRAALVRARQWVKGDGGWVFTRLFLLFVALGILNFILGLFQLRSPHGIGQGIYTVIETGLSVFLIAPFGLCFYRVLYGALRDRKGPTPPALPRAKTIYTVAAIVGALLPIAAGLAAASYGFARLAVPKPPSADMSASSTPSSVLPLPGATKNDRDGDGLSDEAERKLGTDPNNPDTDADGLGDGDEVLFLSTDPTKADTDGDGFPDAQELLSGYNPSVKNELESPEQKAAIRQLLNLGLFHEPTKSTLSILK